jgi:hypothetical protein
MELKNLLWNIPKLYKAAWLWIFFTFLDTGNLRSEMAYEVFGK